MLGDFGIPLTKDNQLYDEEIYFGPKDNKDRYTFIAQGTVNYDNGDQSIFRDYYQFNDSGDIEFVKNDIEEKVAVK